MGVLNWGVIKVGGVDIDPLCRGRRGVVDIFQPDNMYVLKKDCWKRSRLKCTPKHAPD